MRVHERRFHTHNAERLQSGVALQRQWEHIVPRPVDIPFGGKMRIQTAEG